MIIVVTDRWYNYDLPLGYDACCEAICNAIDSLEIMPDHTLETENAAFKYDVSKTTISWDEFINWLSEKNMVPEHLQRYVEKTPGNTNDSKTEDENREGKSNIYPLNDPRHSENRKHQERCRAIAALIWSKNANIPIGHIAESEEILIFGCENKKRAPDTIRDWIKDLQKKEKSENNPQGRGRPPKDADFSIPKFKLTPRDEK